MPVLPARPFMTPFLLKNSPSRDLKAWRNTRCPSPWCLWTPFFISPASWANPLSCLAPQPLLCCFLLSPLPLSPGSKYLKGKRVAQTQGSSFLLFASFQSIILVPYNLNNDLVATNLSFCPLFPQDYQHLRSATLFLLAFCWALSLSAQAVPIGKSANPWRRGKVEVWLISKGSLFSGTLVPVVLAVFIAIQCLQKSCLIFFFIYYPAFLIILGWEGFSAQLIFIYGKAS